MADPLYPLAFDPILKRILWGGRRLGTILGKPLGEYNDYAESWEVSDHRDDVSRVSDGPLTGATLREILHQRGDELMGSAVKARSQFPLLVKYLDAHQVLSVQVHPDDVLGRRLANDNGKTEAWVIVYAEPGSLIYAGLRQGVSRAEFAEAIESGAVEPLLHRFEPKRGDCIMIHAGTVHAIGAGIVLAEIQQMSDATFRIYDWGRVGPDGQPRQLHKSESLEATDFQRGPVDPVRSVPESIDGGTRENLVQCQYFALERLRLTRPTTFGSTDRFTLLLGLGGSAKILQGRDRFDLRFGQTRLLPASVGPCEIVPSDGETTILTCVVPDAGNEAVSHGR
jgi:mannose-6-phosphate isomerase